jgi:hypothetical protein
MVAPPQNNSQTPQQMPKTPLLDSYRPSHPTSKTKTTLLDSYRPHHSKTISKYKPYTTSRHTQTQAPQQHLLPSNSFTGVTRLLIPIELKSIFEDHLGQLKKTCSRASEKPVSEATLINLRQHIELFYSNLVANKHLL